jgi:uncharacterized protein YaiE (UPF0345 family)
MHDWTLLSIEVVWEMGRAELTFRSPDREEVLVSEGVVEVHIPRRREWGPSASVNGVKGPLSINGGLQAIEIEMQSGDVIRIVAASFRMPPKS